jgi:nitrite reductase (NO-forming)
VKNGLQGEIKVNGQTINGVMPKLNLTDEDVAAVLTFVRSSFGTHGDAVTLDEVRAVH